MRKRLTQFRSDVVDRERRRGMVPIEIALSFPLLCVLFLFIMTVAGAGVSVAYVTAQARHDAWSQRYEATPASSLLHNVRLENGLSAIDAIDDVFLPTEQSDPTMGLRSGSAEATPITYIPALRDAFPTIQREHAVFSGVWDDAWLEFENSRQRHRPLTLGERYRAFEPSGSQLQDFRVLKNVP